MPVRMVSTETTFTHAELPTIARALLATIEAAPTEGAALVTLTGDLGAGKTTLVQTLGQVLGVTETITSPTFVVMKQYSIAHEQFDMLVHIDAYRFVSEDEAGPLGLTTLCQTPRTLICLEWPERVPNLVAATPHHACSLALGLTEDTRTLHYSYVTSI